MGICSWDFCIYDPPVSSKRGWNIAYKCFSVIFIGKAVNGREFSIAMCSIQVTIE